MRNDVGGVVFPVDWSGARDAMLVKGQRGVLVFTVASEIGFVLFRSQFQRQGSRLYVRQDSWLQVGTLKSNSAPFFDENELLFLNGSVIIQEKKNQ